MSLSNHCPLIDLIVGRKFIVSEKFAGGLRAPRADAGSGATGVEADRQGP